MLVQVVPAFVVPAGTQLNTGRPREVEWLRAGVDEGGLAQARQCRGRDDAVTLCTGGDVFVCPLYVRHAPGQECHRQRLLHLGWF